LNIKVLQVLDGYGWGGTKEQTYLTTRELKKKGIDVSMALSYQCTEMVEKLADYNIPIYRFENNNKYARYKWENYKRLIDIVNKNDFDIIIANSPHAFDFVRFAKPFIKKKVKIINVKRSGRLPSFLSKHLKYKQADKIVVVSKKVEEYLRENNFFPEKLITIHSGIDLSKFKPMEEKKLEFRKKYNLPLDKKIFINVANWNEDVKGQDKLIKSFLEIPRDDILLILVGKDTDKKVAELGNSLDLKGKVLGLGYQKNIPELLNASDYFVLSSYLEGIAGALLQAMATGKVVISTLAGGIEEYLQDGINGFSVPVGDFNGLKKKMEQVLTLPDDKKKTIVENAINTASQFSIEKTAEKYIQLFNELTKD